MGKIEDKEEAEELFRSKLNNVFVKSMFPIEDSFEVIPLLPDGKDTTFDVGNVTIPAKNIGMKYNTYLDFPYYSQQSLVGDIVEGAKEHDDLIEDEREWEYSMTIEL